MLKLEQRHLVVVNSPYQFYAFGSRVKGTAKRFSDLDLCCKDDLAWNELADLNEEFDESNLPFKVDLVN